MGKNGMCVHSGCTICVYTVAVHHDAEQLATVHNPDASH